MPKKVTVEMWRGQVRIPMPLMKWVQQRAAENFRSVNAELLEIVHEAMKHAQSEHKNSEKE